MSFLKKSKYYCWLAYRKLNDILAYIKDVCFTQHYMIDISNPRNQYKFGIIDEADQILYASFAILSRYVENNKLPANIQVFSATKEILDLYDWWNNTRPQTCVKLSFPEQEAIDQQMLERLVKIRGNLWI